MPTILPTFYSLIYRAVYPAFPRYKGRPLQDVCRNIFLVLIRGPAAAAIEMNCLIPFDQSSPNADWCGCSIRLVLGGAMFKCIK